MPYFYSLLRTITRTTLRKHTQAQCTIRFCSIIDTFFSHLVPLLPPALQCRSRHHPRRSRQQIGYLNRPRHFGSILNVFQRAPTLKGRSAERILATRALGRIAEDRAGEVAGLQPGRSAEGGWTESHERRGGGVERLRLCRVNVVDADVHAVADDGGTEVVLDVAIGLGGLSVNLDVLAIDVDVGSVRAEWTGPGTGARAERRGTEAIGPADVDMSMLIRAVRRGEGRHWRIRMLPASDQSYIMSNSDETNQKTQ